MISAKSAEGREEIGINSPVTGSVPILKSPWASINDVLIQNRCWLCLNHFPRGKTKKVFQVSDLLTFYHNHMSRLIIRSDAAVNDGDRGNDAENETVGGSTESSANLGEVNKTNYKFVSSNLQACYDSYVALMNAAEGSPDLLFKEFKENDVEVWMSGLVCAIGADCKQEAAYFIENKKHAAGGTEDGSKRKVNSMFAFSIPNGTDCPPGCGCDNPWPFMP